MESRSGCTTDLEPRHESLFRVSCPSLGGQLGVWAVIPRVKGTGGPDSAWSWLPAEQVQTFLVSAGQASYPVRQRALR